MKRTVFGTIFEVYKEIERIQREKYKRVKMPKQRGRKIGIKQSEKHYLTYGLKVFSEKSKSQKILFYSFF